MVADHHYIDYIDYLASTVYQSGVHESFLATRALDQNLTQNRKMEN
jgi:hypothetical protein